MNKNIRVVMRLFDEQIVHKLSDAMDVDVAFSSSTVAAPIVTAMALQSHVTPECGARVLSSVMIDGACHVAAEVTVCAGSRLEGKRVDEIERSHAARLLSHRNGQTSQSPPAADAKITAGDRLVVHLPASRLAELAGS
jgi:hypothetical protein